MHIVSSGLSECAGCAKWGPYFQFTYFEGAPLLVYALSKIFEFFFIVYDCIFIIMIAQQNSTCFALCC